MSIFSFDKKRGFTLVEILVTVAVIAILASVVYGAFGEMRKKARDTQRVSNISEIQTALRIINDETGLYPAYPLGVVIGETGGALNAALATHLSSTINDPMGSDSDNTYDYVYNSNFDCAIAGAGRKVLYAKTMERSGAGNWATVCGTAVTGSTNTYGVILQ